MRVATEIISGKYVANYEVLYVIHYLYPSTHHAHHHLLLLLHFWAAFGRYYLTTDIIISPILSYPSS